LWAPDDLLAAHDAWQAGWGDLPYAAFRRPVPPMVQLGSPGQLTRLQADDLRPLERLLLNGGRRDLGPAELNELVGQALSLPTAGRTR
jgi:hypothetical protein